MIVKGQAVSVSLHGEPDTASPGVVEIISDNQLSIAVRFADKPRWSLAPGFFVSPHGVILLAGRILANDQPWGPWVDVVSGGHFEIEAV